MGREIRRVPANWEHPKDDKGNYIPLLDKDAETAAEEWISEYRLWREGKHPKQLENPEIYNKYKYWEYAGGFYPDSYRPKFESEPTWFQLYETVSEGSPVSPPFATEDELIDYLVKNGDFWDQKRGSGGWDLESATRTVKGGYCPSMGFIDGKFVTPGHGL